MDGEAPSRSGGVKSRRSRSFSGLLGGYPRNYQGPRSRSGEAEDEEGEESVEEEESEETEVAAALAADPNFLKMMEPMTQFMGQLTQEASPINTSRAPEFKTP
ncbi:hypothetical protein O181_063356 [Austropuccinia psidii MF-1]|uniref:Uncharacterized protein n=1 Tax=Austropuccinia psidii MF-1 TaxID=1389203 RepID=A0A9Q3ERM2_9BASI|nr:hypothetical protein [Austropuccinia psidii MF-1]